MAGLVFSILTQFSGERYTFGKKHLDKEKVPDYYAIGRSAVEKIAYGFLYWVLNLAIDIAASRRSLLDDMVMPNEILKLIKELFRLPVFKNILCDYKKVEEQFSKWIIKIFEKSKFKDDTGEIRDFSLQKEMDLLSIQGIENSVPVLINECIVRILYLIKKLISEIREKNIHSISELDAVDTESVLPFNNRIVSKMIMISSGCFVGVNVAGAAIKAVFNMNKKGGKFSKTLFTEIDIVGVGRFVFACIADSKYWSDDIKIFLQRMAKNRKAEDVFADEQIADDMVGNDSFKVISMTPMQTRALYSVEALSVKWDIDQTKDEEDKHKKQSWLELWKKSILNGMDIDSPDYFVEDEKVVYDAFYGIRQNEDDLSWFYLLAMELVVFKPYYPLGTKKDDDFKKLTQGKKDYVDEQFVRLQTIVSQSEIDSFRNSYKKYKGTISGSTQNAIMAAGILSFADAF